MSGEADRTRLEAMFRANHEIVWRTLCRFGVPRDAAADATQHAFLIAAERLSDIRIGCERAFVLRTAIRLGRAAGRKARRCELSCDMDIHPDRTALGGNVAAKVGSRSLLDQILADMDPELIATFVLFELEGMSTVEIAEALETPPGTVASRLRRARETFRLKVSRLEEKQKFDAGYRQAARQPFPVATPRSVRPTDRPRSWLSLLPSVFGRRSHLEVK
jgi:RNA polymerase sigma-70 factor, ECF subfamily